jgi:arginine repressor
MKQQRHNAIRELLVNTVVTNQDELRRKLAGMAFMSRKRRFRETYTNFA